jgi:hypothetical protein
MNTLTLVSSVRIISGFLLFLSFRSCRVEGSSTKYQPHNYSVFPVNQNYLFSQTFTHCTTYCKIRCSTHSKIRYCIHPLFKMRVHHKLVIKRKSQLNSLHINAQPVRIKMKTLLITNSVFTILYGMTVV